MAKTTKKYVLYLPSQMVYLGYDNSKQEFTTTFNVNDAAIIQVVAETGENLALDHHKHELQNKLDSTFRRHFSQRSMLMESIVVEVVEHMVRTVSKVDKTINIPFGDFIE